MHDLDGYKGLLARGRMTRRDFIQRAMALGATAALAAAMAGQALAAAPKKGGRLRLGLSLGLGHGSTSDSLDPATILDPYMQVVNYGLRNSLTEVTAAGDIVADLAEGWEATPDAVTWTFRLKKGVEFHNGKTLDADDVVASIEHHLGEDSKSAAKAVLQPIEAVKADGKDTVVFKMKAGNADFPFIVSDYRVTILPAKDGKVDARSGIGTGGYVLDTFEPGVRTTLKRFPNYFRSDRAHVDEAEVLAIPDVAARTNALTTGEIDAMDKVDIKTSHLLKRNKGIAIQEAAGAQHFTFAMLSDVAPFDNNDVRLALKYALDREALLRAILRGHGALGNDHPIGPGQRHFAKNLPQRTYDIDRARFHLKQAGLSSLKVDLSAADAAFAGAVDAAFLYKEHAAKAGIDINVVREANEGYWSNVWRKKPWCAAYWSGRPTVDWMFTTAYAAGAPWNDSHWNHEAFNKILVQARAELDPGKRAGMYFELQQICRDEGGVVVPMFASYVMALSDRIGHGKLATNWDMDGRKAIERWWMT